MTFLNFKNNIMPIMPLNLERCTQLCSTQCQVTNN